MEGLACPKWRCSWGNEARRKGTMHQDYTSRVHLGEVLVPFLQKPPEDRLLSTRMLVLGMNPKAGRMPITILPPPLRSGERCVHACASAQSRVFARTTIRMRSRYRLKRHWRAASLHIDAGTIKRALATLFALNLIVMMSSA